MLGIARFSSSRTPCQKGSVNLSVLGHVLEHVLGKFAIVRLCLGGEIASAIDSIGIGINNNRGISSGVSRLQGGIGGISRLQVDSGLEHVNLDKSGIDEEGINTILGYSGTSSGSSMSELASASRQSSSAS